MSKIIDKIDKLIQQGKTFVWEKSSYNVPEFGPDAIFGSEPSAEWNTWSSRINQVLHETAKPNSEPFVYYHTANSAIIPGNHRDKFDMAKDGYLGALTTLKNLIEEGDIFDELLITTASKNLPEKENNVIPSPNLNEKKVFIVHGHDHNLKIELEVFLTHIGLKPIVLHREADSGKTIIEKFESNSDVAYAFILLTPDEIAYTISQETINDSERKKEFRARPNVIFEFGYFAAKLGRSRVCALHKSNVSIPSDLSGFIYKQIDTNVEEIGFSLIKELKAAGLKIEI